MTTYEDGVDRALATIREACANQRDAPAERRLRAAVGTLMELLAADPDMARLVVVDAPAASSSARQRRAEALDQLVAMIRPLLAELRPSGDPGPTAARVLVGGVLEIVHAAIERGDSASLPELAGDLTEAQLSLVTGC